MSLTTKNINVGQRIKIRGGSLVWEIASIQDNAIIKMVCITNPKLGDVHFSRASVEEAIIRNIIVEAK